VTHLERALELDPHYSRAHAALAAVYAAVVDKNWSTGTTMWSYRLGMNTDRILELEERHLTRALEDPVPLAHQVAAARLSRQGRHEEALAQAERSLALDPNDPNSHRTMAAALVYAGRPTEAAAEIAQAMRLDPHFPQEYLYWLGLAQFGMARFDEAATTLERAAASNPDDDRSLIMLAASYGHLGQVEKAQAAMTRANAIRMARQRELGPGVRAGIDALLVGAYSLQDLDLWPFALDADRERLREGLARAGVPETGADENVSPLEVAGTTTVDATTAKALLDRNVPFVDVRGEGSWADGHILGAVHLDLKEDFTEAALAQVVGRDQEVVIYCMGPRCLLSSEACKQAAAWGFRKVYYFREGFPAWKAAGYPVALP
jgi:adenylate cyclase